MDPDVVGGRYRGGLYTLRVLRRLAGMSIEVSYLLRKDEPGASLRELDAVVLLADASTDDGAVIQAGTEGTIVGLSRATGLCIVEFSQPAGALADVQAASLKRVDR